MFILNYNKDMQPFFKKSPTFAQGYFSDLTEIARAQKKMCLYGTQGETNDCFVFVNSLQTSQSSLCFGFCER